MAVPSSSCAATLAKKEYKGWSVYELSNGILSLMIAPDLGGRAIQLQLGDQEFFFVNPALAGKVLPERENNRQSGWADYGGDKVWPAPEGWMTDQEWPSVPYFVLDGCKFSSEITKETPDEVALRVTSPPDPRTGVQFVRTFHVYAGTTRIQVDQAMRNISRRQIRWGIWHLIQHDAADLHNPSRPNPELYAYVPLNPHSRFRRGYYNPLGDRRHPSYETMAGGRLLRIHYLYRVGKVAADSNAGWMAVVNGQKNIGFVENFKWFPGQEYPDDSSVASWNNGPGTVSRESWDQTLPDDPAKTLYYMESEVLSPYAELDPGEEYGFRVHWSPTSVTNPIVDVTWGGAISVPLKGTLDQGEEDIRLQGILGVFTPGELVVTFYSALGEELACQPLMQVDPREVARLDKRVRLPKGTFRASIFVRDEVGENRGLLANVVVNRR